jgi:tetratricopeptide (TPR) repeat protein
MEHHVLGETLQPDFKKGGYYHTTFTARKLSVNRPLPDDALDFRFPENLQVQQTQPGMESTKFFIWGPDNKPAKTFESAQAFNRYTMNDEMAQMKRRVDKNRDSKKPKDLVERGEYAMYTKDFDAALAAFSEVVSTVPKSEEAVMALSGRGFVNLFYKRDFDKAAADFTEIIRLTSKEKDEDATMVYILRGLAYAQQEKTLDKALADLTTALGEKESPAPLSEDDQYWAYLVRAAILVRQNKSAADLALAMKDVEKVLSVHRGAEAYAIAVAICEKQGNHAKAAELGETAKQKTEKPIDSDGLEADFAAAARDCVARLVPGIEKK